MSDGAPRKDSVTIRMVQNSNDSVRMEMADKIVRLGEQDPSRWHVTLNESIVVPLFEKGARKTLGNYRGICLLPMASRMIARVMATRLRTWSEKSDLVGDTQCGFRAGRSTTDAAQIIVRIHEELRETESTHPKNYTV